MNQMPFTPNMPMMSNPYQNMIPNQDNSFIEQRLQTLEQKVQNLENNIKQLEKKLNNTKESDYFKYQSSMHMM